MGHWLQKYSPEELDFKIAFSIAGNFSLWLIGRNMSTSKETGVIQLGWYLVAEVRKVTSVRMQYDLQAASPQKG
jgi:hypothetical protein